MAPEAEELSPEEKLLKVIQDGSKKPEQSAASQAVKPLAPLPAAQAPSKAGTVQSPLPGRKLPPPQAGAGSATPPTAATPGSAQSPGAKPAVPGAKPPPDRNVKLGAPKPSPSSGQALPASGQAHPASGQASAKAAVPVGKPQPGAKPVAAKLGQPVKGEGPKTVDTAASPAGKSASPLIGKGLDPSEKEEAVSEAPPTRKDGPRAGAAVSLVSRFLVLLLLVLTAGLAWEILAAKPVAPEIPESIVLVEDPHELTKLGPIDPYIAAAISNRITEEFAVSVSTIVTTVETKDPAGVVGAYIAKNLSLDAIGGSVNGKSFAVVTDNKAGGSSYLSAGDKVEIGVDGPDKTVVVTVSEVREESVLFLYEGNPIILEARR